MKWHTRGKDISPQFMNWICRSELLIIPPLENKIIPASTFSRAKSVVAIDWSRSFIEKNLNKKAFPKLEYALILKSNNIKTNSNPDFRIITGLEDGFLKDDGRVQWNGMLVNKEWLESQYHEYISAMQTFYDLRENELR